MSEISPEERRLLVELGNWTARAQIAESKLARIAQMLDEAEQRNTAFYATAFPDRKVTNTQIYVHQVRKALS